MINHKRFLLFSNNKDELFTGGAYDYDYSYEEVEDIISAVTNYSIHYDIVTVLDLLNDNKYSFNQDTIVEDIKYFKDSVEYTPEKVIEIAETFIEQRDINKNFKNKCIEQIDKIKAEHPYIAYNETAMDILKNLAISIGRRDTNYNPVDVDFPIIMNIDKYTTAKEKLGLEKKGFIGGKS